MAECFNEEDNMFIDVNLKYGEYQPQIKITKDHYEALVCVAKESKFSQLPSRWLKAHPFPQWSTLISAPGKSFQLGLCWEWAGPLKFGLVSQKCSNVEEVYSIISKLVDHFRRLRFTPVAYSKPLKFTKERLYPFSFLKFIHIGSENFIVKYNQSLRYHNDTPLGLMMVAKKYDQRKLMEYADSLRFSQRLYLLREEAEAISHARILESCNVKIVTFPKSMSNISEANKLKDILHAELDKRLADEEKEEEEEVSVGVKDIEGLESIQFMAELERGIAHISGQLEQQGHVMDYELLCQMMYDDPIGWEHNASLYKQICEENQYSNSIEEFISQNVMDYFLN